MNATLKRRKSASSHAASISACFTVFDWPSIVAALSVSRHGPVSSSAARRKTVARSSHGHRCQSSHAAAAASIACWTSAAPPRWGPRGGSFLVGGPPPAPAGLTGADVAAADQERDLEPLAAHLVEPAA